VQLPKTLFWLFFFESGIRGEAFSYVLQLAEAKLVMANNLAVSLLPETGKHHENRGPALNEAVEAGDQVLSVSPQSLSCSQNQLCFVVVQDANVSRQVINAVNLQSRIANWCVRLDLSRRFSASAGGEVLAAK